MTVVILIVVVAFVGYRITTVEDRERHLKAAAVVIHRLREIVTRSQPEGDAFRSALRDRLPRATVTLALAGMMAVATLFLDPATFSNTALKTTNGEWWRLVTAIFVQGSVLQLVINALILTQVGFFIERLIGNVGFAATFIAAGIFGNIIDLAQRPIAVSSGASAAIFGLYGLLIATVIWSLRHRSTVTMPLPTIKTVSLVAVVYMLLSLVNDRLCASAEVTGLLVGLCCGAVLARGVSEEHAPPKRVGAVAGVFAVIAVVAAIPLHGLMDVRPEIKSVVELEGKTTTVYQTATEQFRKGKLSAEALAQVIDRTILPELHAADDRLKTYTKVPPEHQPMISDAEEYLTLRCKSWQLRADAIRKTNATVKRDPAKSDQNWRLSAEARHRANLVALGNAEGSERTSLEAFQKIKTP